MIPSKTWPPLVLPVNKIAQTCAVGINQQIGDRLSIMLTVTRDHSSLAPSHAILHEPLHRTELTFAYQMVKAEAQGHLRNPSASSRSKYLRADPSLGFKVSARTVAKYIRLRSNRGPSPGWGKFLKRHASNIWVCDFFAFSRFCSRFSMSSS
jgi:hypothetical protein